MKIFSESGSSPLEIVIFAVILLLPVMPMLNLYEQISNQLAAESIARHGLRAAVFGYQSGESQQLALDRSLGPLQESWGKRVVRQHLFCTPSCETGNLLHLEIEIGGARAIQSAGLAEQ